MAESVNKKNASKTTPKRREGKTAVLDKHGKLNTKHEIFLLGFETNPFVERNYFKPHYAGRIFLHRNLTYLKPRKLQQCHQYEVVNINNNVILPNYSSQNQIYYEFTYNNSIKQNVRWKGDGFKCPWCALNCNWLYGLMKHMVLTHSRLSFTLMPQNFHQINVTLNRFSDRSSDDCLENEEATTQVFRRVKQRFCVCEFYEVEPNAMGNQSCFMPGHGTRVYYHCMTRTPVRPEHLDNDSEDECAQEWLQCCVKKRIDALVDVNEDEKDFMKMWNLHVLKKNCVARCRMQAACEDFVDEHRHALLEISRYRIFVLHLCTLVDYGAISRDGLLKCVQRLQRVSAAGNLTIDEGRENQMERRVTKRRPKKKSQNFEATTSPTNINAPRAINGTDPTPGTSGLKTRRSVKIVEADKGVSTTSKFGLKSMNKSGPFVSQENGTPPLRLRLHSSELKKTTNPSPDVSGIEKIAQTKDTPDKTKATTS